MCCLTTALAGEWGVRQGNTFEQHVPFESQPEAQLVRSSLQHEGHVVAKQMLSTNNHFCSSVLQMFVVMLKAALTPKVST